jgi:hypothetical protein
MLRVRGELKLRKHRVVHIYIVRAGKALERKYHRGWHLE